MPIPAESRIIIMGCTFLKASTVIKAAIPKERSKSESTRESKSKLSWKNTVITIETRAEPIRPITAGRSPVITEETGAVSDTGETTDPSAGTTEIPGAVTDTTGGAGKEPVTGESGTTEKSGEDAPYTGDRKVLPLILLAASCAGAFGIAVCFQRKKETK